MVEVASTHQRHIAAPHVLERLNSALVSQDRGVLQLGGSSKLWVMPEMYAKCLKSRCMDPTTNKLIGHAEMASIRSVDYYLSVVLPNAYDKAMASGHDDLEHQKPAIARALSCLVDPKGFFDPKHASSGYPDTAVYAAVLTGVTRCYELVKDSLEDLECAK